MSKLVYFKLTLVEATVRRSLCDMCDDCFKEAHLAATKASIRLPNALQYFDTESGRNEVEPYKLLVQAAQRAVTEVLGRNPTQAARRATQADVDALELARSAFLRMADTFAGQTKPYRDYSEDQLVLAGAIGRIRAIWSADPEAHPS